MEALPDLTPTSDFSMSSADGTQRPIETTAVWNLLTQGELTGAENWLHSLGFFTR